MTAPVVSIRGASKRYGQRLAVDGLDLDVPDGQCFGLLGPNGAGKTTTLRMIYGAARPSAGTVSVFGRDMARHGRAVRARLGVTLQDNVLIETATARENMEIFGRPLSAGCRDHRAPRRHAGRVSPARLPRRHGRPATLRRVQAAPRRRAVADEHAGTADPRRADHRARPQCSPGAVVAGAGVEGGGHDGC